MRTRRTWLARSFRKAMVSPRYGLRPVPRRATSRPVVVDLPHSPTAWRARTRRPTSADEDRPPWAVLTTRFPPALFLGTSWRLRHDDGQPRTSTPRGRRPFGRAAGHAPLRHEVDRRQEHRQDFRSFRGQLPDEPAGPFGPRDEPVPFHLASCMARICLLIPGVFRSVSLNLWACPKAMFISVRSAHFRPRTPRLPSSGYAGKLKVAWRRPGRRLVTTDRALLSFAYRPI